VLDGRHDGGKPGSKRHVLVDRQGTPLAIWLTPATVRDGQLLTAHGVLVIRNARYAEDREAPDPDCGCYTCRHFSRAYLRHLFMADEMTAATLMTVHNLYFYLDLMRGIRDAIGFGSFEKLRSEFHQTFSRRQCST